ncbi:MAG: alpha/beta hydrolase [Betaproteobacteria bacterium]|nr:alpha/beta hydrolase [Betaproteobacteria bacterium]
MYLTVNNHKTFAYTGTRPLKPEQPTAMFVHGAANDHSVWALQSRYFAHHGRNVLAVDLPRHGRSEGTPLGSIAAIADWMPKVLDAAGVEKAALVGHSMGSLAVLEAAARHPSRVSAVALLGASAPMPVTDALLDAAKANDHSAFDMLNIWGHMSPMGPNPNPGLWMLGGYVRLLERSAPGVLYNDLKACNDYLDGVEAARKVQCPVLVIQGRRDLMTPPRNAKELLAALPRAQTVSVDGCGHSMMLEQPDEVLDALIGFL